MDPLNGSASQHAQPYYRKWLYVTSGQSKQTLTPSKKTPQASVAKVQAKIWTPEATIWPSLEPRNRNALSNSHSNRGYITLLVPFSVLERTGVPWYSSATREELRNSPTSNTTWDDMDTTAKSRFPKRSTGSMPCVEEPGSWEHTHVLEVFGFYKVSSQPRHITSMSCRGRNE